MISISFSFIETLMKIRIFCKLNCMNIYIYSKNLYFLIDKSHREMRMQPWGILREGFNVLLATLWLVVLLMWGICPILPHFCPFFQWMPHFFLRKVKITSREIYFWYFLGLPLHGNELPLISAWAAPYTGLNCPLKCPIFAPFLKNSCPISAPYMGHFR